MSKRLVCALAAAACFGAVDPGPRPEGMFEFYARNRAMNRPNYITGDFLLLTHSMVLDRVTAEFEERTAAPALAALAAGLESRLKEQPGNSFARILAALAAGGTRVEGAGENAELHRILEAKAIERSPLFRQTIDYTQFLPRGRYTASAALTNYFRAYRFASTVLFPVLESGATGISAEDADFLTSQALAISRAVAGSPELQKNYDALEGHLAFFFGPADDLPLSDYAAFAPAAKPAEARRQLLDLNKRPRIIGSVVDATRLEPGRSPYDVLTGFRLLPQRFTPDAAALGELVYPQAGTYIGAASSSTPFTLGVIGGQKVKAFPTGKELMSMLGSAEAAKLIQGDTRYSRYVEARLKAEAALESAAGLASDHLLLLRAWLAPAPEADAAQRLRSALSYWTAYRHAGVLYVKQSYTGLGKGFSVSSPRQGAWIEPAPELFLLLRRQASMAQRHVTHPSLAAWEEALDRCIEIAYSARFAGKLSPAEEDYLNGLDEKLLALAGRADRPIVVDVHTDPASGQVVEEGIGFPVSTTAKGRPAVGALFSHYEFKQPVKDRLTGEAWLKMLREKKEVHQQ